MGNKLGTRYQQFVTKTADYTVADADDVVFVNAVAGAVTITLPTPVGRFPNEGPAGRVRIVKTDPSAFPVIVVAAAGGTIVGQSVLRDQNQAVDFTADGISQWMNFAPRVRNFQVRVALSAADIIAMNGAPITLIPAPGAGKAIVVDNVSFVMTRTATQFTNGGALSFQYPTGPVAATATIAATVVTGAAGVVVQNVKGIEASLAATVNEAIQITNASAAFATGTGTAVVEINYHISGE